MITHKNLFVSPISEYGWNRSTKPLEDIKNSIVHYSKSEEFMSWILECAADYASNVNKTGGYLVCRDIWIRTMRNPYSYVPPHIHPNAWAVGSFYFEDGQGDLVLFDPRGYLNEQWQWTEIKDIDGNMHSSCTDYYYNPKKNTCIMFPAYLKHMVLPSANQRKRTTISWNITFEDDLEIVESQGIEKNRCIKL